jgi:antitoxin component YwqK of YwqJK toxin-antitoxin module
VQDTCDSNLLKQKDAFINSRFDINEDGFYGQVRADTNFYTDGKIAAIGHFAVDRNNRMSGTKVGLWIEYYHNGQIRSKGTYAMYSLLYASLTTTKRLETSYKIGQWEYYYENGQLKAKGEYEIRTLPARTGVANQFHKTPIATGHWLFFNEDGSVSKDKQKIIGDIEYVPH